MCACVWETDTERKSNNTAPYQQSPISVDLMSTLWDKIHAIDFMRQQNFSVSVYWTSNEQVISPSASGANHCA